MAKIIYKGRNAKGVWVGHTFCAHGETVDVPDDTAKALLVEQPTQFSTPTPKTSPKKKETT